MGGSQTPKSTPTFQSTESKLNEEPFCADVKSQSQPELSKALGRGKTKKSTKTVEKAGLCVLARVMNRAAPLRGVKDAFGQVACRPHL